MLSALPSALWVRLLEYIREGFSGPAAAARLKLSAATGMRWQGLLLETGLVEPAVPGHPPGHGKMASYQELLEELVAQDGDITSPKFAGVLETAIGVIAHSASIWRFLNKLGYTYKKVAGCDWAPPRPCKASLAGLDQILNTYNAGSVRPIGLYCRASTLHGNGAGACVDHVWK
jgi:transposase